MKPPISLGVDDFTSQTSPRLDYYLGRTYEALGKSDDARRSYSRAITGAESLTGDRDSFNSENFYMVLALERLDRKEEAARLVTRFGNFARTELDDKRAYHRSESHYLLGLIAKHDGRTAEARKLFEGALKAQPELLAPRLELRGDEVDAVEP
jgi:tetratricopeptide (TPR) repeat protein